VEVVQKDFSAKKKVVKKLRVEEVAAVVAAEKAAVAIEEQ